MVDFTSSFAETRPLFGLPVLYLFYGSFVGTTQQLLPSRNLDGVVAIQFLDRAHTFRPLM